MSDERTTECRHFEDRLAYATPGEDLSDWQKHLAECPACELQWRMHAALLATLADEPVPNLSPAFPAGLQRKLETDIEVRPLGGWRILLLGGYAAGVIALMSWIFDKYPLPEISIDPSSPWITVAAFLATPLTLLGAAAASRFLPQPKTGETVLPSQ